MLNSKENNIVYMLKAGSDMKVAVRRLLSAIFGEQKPWCDSLEVLIKPNAVNFEPHVYVDPSIIAAFVSVMKEDGVKRVTVMESCTNGSFTRLVFEATGIKKAVLDAGGRCVFLDEGAASVVEMGECGSLEVPSFVADRLLQNRKDYFYINLAKLKTHSMTTVTLCLKNQWCFVDPKHRGALHNDILHNSIDQVNKLFVPDLCVVEGLVATNHGHFPLNGYESECLWNAGVLIGGRSAVATDAASCRLIGINPSKVQHIANFAKDQNELNPKVEHLDKIDSPPDPFTDELLPFFPDDIVIHKGSKRCCKEGCYSNPVCAVQVLAANYGGHGGFHIFMGCGHDAKEVESCKGPVLAVGVCAKAEVYEKLLKRLGKRKVKLSNGHNNLKQTLSHLIPMMGISIFKSSPLPPHKFIAVYLRHLLAGSRADIGFF